MEEWRDCRGEAKLRFDWDVAANWRNVRDYIVRFSIFAGFRKMHQMPCYFGQQLVIGAFGASLPQHGTFVPVGSFISYLLLNRLNE